MLCKEGRLALRSFGIAALLLVLDVLRLYFFIGPWATIKEVRYIEPVILIAIVLIAVFLTMEGEAQQIAIRSVFLGIVFAFGLLLVCLQSQGWRAFGLYAMFMSHFHFSEYVAIAWTSPKELKIDSFMLYHSLPYVIAAIASWCEFCIEFYFYPELKSYILPVVIGGSICIFGEFLRKLAIFTAHSNFNHVVQYEKARNHELVTHGVYSMMRHPSYVGWFMWSVGTQIILLNPLCIIIYMIVIWRFFKSRIFMEEITLLNFFGEEYYNYQQKVPTGIPFIRGYVVQHNVPSPK